MSLRTIRTIANDKGDADVITGGAGGDIVLAGTGGDLVNAGQGDNLVLGDNGEIIVDHGAPNLGAIPLTFLSVATKDAHFGGSDTITTGQGADLILGGAGGDVITTAPASGAPSVTSRV